MLQFCPLSSSGCSRKFQETYWKETKTKFCKEWGLKEDSWRMPCYLSFHVFPSLPFCQGTPWDTNIYDLREAALCQSFQSVWKFCCQHCPHSALRNHRFQSSWMGETDPRRNWELLSLSLIGTIRTGTMSYTDCSSQKVGVTFKVFFCTCVFNMKGIENVGEEGHFTQRDCHVRFLWPRKCVDHIFQFYSEILQVEPVVHLPSNAIRPHTPVGRYHLWVRILEYTLT